MSLKIDTTVVASTTNQKNTNSVSLNSTNEALLAVLETPDTLPNDLLSKRDQLKDEIMGVIDISRDFFEKMQKAVEEEPQQIKKGKDWKVKTQTQCDRLKRILDGVLQLAGTYLSNQAALYRAKTMLQLEQARDDFNKKFKKDVVEECQSEELMSIAWELKKIGSTSKIYDDISSFLCRKEFKVIPGFIEYWTTDLDIKADLRSKSFISWYKNYCSKNSDRGDISDIKTLAVTSLVMNSILVFSKTRTSRVNGNFECLVQDIFQRLSDKLNLPKKVTLDFEALFNELHKEVLNLSDDLYGDFLIGIFHSIGPETFFKHRHYVDRLKGYNLVSFLKKLLSYKRKYQVFEDRRDVFLELVFNDILKLENPSTVQRLEPSHQVMVLLEVLRRYPDLGPMRQVIKHAKRFGGEQLRMLLESMIDNASCQGVLKEILNETLRLQGHDLKNVLERIYALKPGKQLVENEIAQINEGSNQDLQKDHGFVEFLKEKRKVDLCNNQLDKAKNLTGNKLSCVLTEILDNNHSDKICLQVLKEAKRLEGLNLFLVLHKVLSINGHESVCLKLLELSKRLDFSEQAEFFINLIEMSDNDTIFLEVLNYVQGMPCEDLYRILEKGLEVHKPFTQNNKVLNKILQKIVSLRPNLLVQKLLIKILNDNKSPEVKIQILKIAARFGIPARLIDRKSYLTLAGRKIEQVLSTEKWMLKHSAGLEKNKFYSGPSPQKAKRIKG